MTLIDPIRFTPVQLETLDLGYSAFPDIQPFSARAGIGYQELLESIRRYITKTLIPYLVDVNPQALWDGNVDKLMVALDAAITQSQTEINAALDAQKAQVAQNLADTLAQIVAGESAPLYDAQVYAALESASSTALALLDGRYAPSTVADAINTGRLSTGSLDAKYLLTDEALEPILADENSTSRQLLDGVYKRLEFQLSTTALQFRYIGDATWTDLIPIAEITGPTGSTGNPGGNAELAYAERTTDFAVPSGSLTGTLDVAGLTISFTMPSRPVMLDFGGVLQDIASTTANTGYVTIVETTGGTNTILASVYAEKVKDTGDFCQVFGRRRITGTAGVVRSFKIQAQQRVDAWTIKSATNYPTYFQASQC